MRELPRIARRRVEQLGAAKANGDEHNRTHDRAGAAKLEMIRELVRAGMDVARLNFSHGTHEGHASDLRRGAASIGPLAAEAGVRPHASSRGTSARRRVSAMSESNRLKYLKFALQVFAVLFIFGFYPLTVVWPSGWAWHAGQSEYLQMLTAIYATLGVLLWPASRDPVRHVASSPSPSGPASFTLPLWLCSRLPTCSTSATCTATFQRFSL